MPCRRNCATSCCAISKGARDLGASDRTVHREPKTNPQHRRSSSGRWWRCFATSASIGLVNRCERFSTILPKTIPGVRLRDRNSLRHFLWASKPGSAGMSLCLTGLPQRRPSNRTFAYVVLFGAKVLTPSTRQRDNACAMSCRGSSMPASKKSLCGNDAAACTEVANQDQYRVGPVGVVRLCKSALRRSRSMVSVSRLTQQPASRCCQGVVGTLYLRRRLASSWLCGAMKPFWPVKRRSMLIPFGVQP